VDVLAPAEGSLVIVVVEGGLGPGRIAGVGARTLYSVIGGLAPVRGSGNRHSYVCSVQRSRMRSTMDMKARGRARG